MDGTTPKLLESARIEKLVAVFLLAAAVFVAFLAIGAIRDVFSPRPALGNIISVEGSGIVTAIPDIARVTFSVSEEADNASGAQDAAAKKVNVALAVLEDLGIDEKDVKTTSYIVSPKYSRPQPCYDGFCPEYEQTIIGYTASQSVDVKVRDTAQVGNVLSELGDAGVSNLSGPSFTIDDPEALQAQAREIAIEDARAKAHALAKDLNVRLVRVTGFWENSDPHYPYESKVYGLGGDDTVSNVPSLPVGEDEIAVSVNISYEIR